MQHPLPDEHYAWGLTKLWKTWEGSDLQVDLDFVDPIAVHIAITAGDAGPSVQQLRAARRALAAIPSSAEALLADTSPYWQRSGYLIERLKLVVGKKSWKLVAEFKIGRKWPVLAEGTVDS